VGTVGRGVGKSVGFLVGFLVGGEVPLEVTLEIRLEVPFGSSWENNVTGQLVRKDLFSINGSSFGWVHR